MFFFPKIVLSLHAHSGMFFAFLVYDQKGEMAEWSIAAVLKTVEVQASGGSNPSLSAIKGVNQLSTWFAPYFISLFTYPRFLLTFTGNINGFT